MQNTKNALVLFKNKSLYISKVLKNKVTAIIRDVEKLKLKAFKLG